MSCLGLERGDGLPSARERSGIEWTGFIPLECSKGLVPFGEEVGRTYFGRGVGLECGGGAGCLPVSAGEKGTGLRWSFNRSEFASDSMSKKLSRSWDVFFSSGIVRLMSSSATEASEVREPRRKRLCV